MTSEEETPTWLETEEEEESIEVEQNALTDEVRFTVLDRDGWQCQNCGESDPDKLTLHHVKYRSHGGGDNPDNLCTLCWFCHRMIHDYELLVKEIGGHWYFKYR